MKATLRLSMIALALGMGVLQANAQITITKKGYPYKPGTDIFHIDTDGTKVSLPEEGADKTYDYSNLTKDETIIHENFNGSKNKSFPEASVKRKTVFSIAGFEFRVHQYFALTDESFYGVGRTQFDSTHSLTAVTGGPSDEIHYPNADLRYANTRDYIKFPMTYGDAAWTETESEVTEFDLTIAAFGLNKTPGTTVKHKTNEREIVGYGKLIIPDDDGKASQGIDVLLVKVIDTRVDSVFLGGAPAPKALLDAFGFTQGQTTVLRSYAFEMIGLGRQPLILAFDEAGNTMDALFRTEAVKVATGVNVISETASVYPSTLKSGSILSIDMESNTKLSQVSLTNLQGISVAIETVSPGKFLVPANLASGMYLYEAKNEESMHIASGKLVIIE